MNENELPVIGNDLCSTCFGGCCRSCGHPLFTREPLPWVHELTPAEREWHDMVLGRYLDLPENLKREIDEYLAALDGDDCGRPCIWLDQTTGKCRHYEYRPQPCRDFEPGSVDCRRKFMPRINANFG